MKGSVTFFRIKPVAVSRRREVTNVEKIRKKRISTHLK